MVKYCGHSITAQEVPNHISLVFSISNCNHNCPGCHSPWLRGDIGDALTPDVIQYLEDRYHAGVTCVCFMGTGGDNTEIARLNDFVQRTLGLATCIYTGDDDLALLDVCKQHGYCLPDFIKYGHYDQALGGLDSPTTNQRMLQRVRGNQYEDVTDWFRQNKGEELDS